jgi:hypothetical protein
MAQIIDLGKLRFTYTGVWSSGSTYEFNDVVSYGGNLYIWKDSATSSPEDLPTNTEYWDLILHGAKFTGNWDNATAYKVGELAINGARTYLCILDTTAGIVVSNATYWALFVDGVQYEGEYSAGDTYQKNDIVSYGGSTYIVNVATTTGNAPTNLDYWNEFVEGGYPNQTGQDGALLQTDGTNVSWQQTPTIVGLTVTGVEYVGETAEAFETSAGLTSPAAVFDVTSADNTFGQLAVHNNNSKSSTDIIAYADLGNDSEGWVDMGIAGSHFDSATYGITGAYDGYIFINAPAQQTASIVYKQLISNTATLTTTSPHGFIVGNQVVITDVDSTFNGTYIITTIPNTSSFSYVKSHGNVTLAAVSPFGTVTYSKGKGNLVLATGANGSENAIIIAAGGYDSGRRQMSIWPDLTVNVNISTDSTSPTTGALTVNGGAGFVGTVFIGGDLNVVGQVDFSGVDYIPIGPGAKTFADTLTNPTIVAVTSHNNYAQIAHQNQSNGNKASTDIIVYPDNGADGAGFMDMGITSSMFSDPLFTITGKNDGYIFMSAPAGTAGKGDLVLATDITGSRNAIVLAAGGFADNYQQVVLTSTNMVVNIPTASTSATTGAFQVVGGVGISGDMNIAGAVNIVGNLTFGGGTTTTQNLAVSNPMIFLGDGALADDNDLGIVGQYEVNLSTVTKVVSNKALTSNVATLTTTTSHGFLVGDVAVVSGVDTTFNGTFPVTAVTSTTFSYAKTATNVTSASSSGSVSVSKRANYYSITRDKTDGVIKFASGITSKPLTTVDYTGTVFAPIKTGAITTTGSITGGSTSDIAINTSKFTVAAATGNMLVGGTFTLAGNISVPAWTTSGVRHVSGTAIITDTTSSGTVATAYTNNFGGNTTIAASSATTYTTYATAFFSAPNAGTNVAFTNPYSIYANGAVYANGAITTTGAITGGSSSNITINTNKFTVAASTGNTVIGGTADISGNTTVGGTLVVTGVETNGGLTNTLLEIGIGNSSNTSDLGVYYDAKETTSTPLVATVSNKALTSNVATLTTSAAHNLLAGDSVVVSTVDATFNGTYTVTTVPTSTTFSYAKTATDVVSTAATSTGTFTVTNKALTSNVATLTTASAHGFTTGQSVVVSSVDATFNGTYTIAATPTTTTFTYAKTAADVTSQAATGTPVIVTYKALTSNVATLTTATVHGFTTGQTVVIGGIDVTFNGTYVITSTPTTTTFTYAKSAVNVASTPAGASPTVITTKALTSNVATLTTATVHGLTTGQYVAVQNVDSTFNGVWLVASTPTTTTFTYAVTAGNVTSQEAGTNAGTFVTVKDLTSNVATLSTYTVHGLNVGDTVVIAGVDANFNGTYTVTAVPTLYSFSYAKTLSYNEGAAYAGTFGSSTITTAALTTNVITYTTSAVHGLQVGGWVTVIGANNDVYNGTYIIATVPTTTTFTVAKANIDVVSATVNGTVYPLSIGLTNGVLTSNVVTLTTIAVHGLTTGQWISVQGAGTTYNGIYQITSTPTTTTLTYARTSANITTAALAAPSRISPLLGTIVKRTGTSSVTAGTSATITGTAASNTLAGTATVSAPVRTTYAGLVKKVSDSTFRLFTSLQTKPGTTVNFSGTGLTYGNLQLNNLTAAAATLSSTLAVTGASTFSGDVSGSASSGYLNFNPKVNNLGTVTGSINVSTSSGSVILIQPIGNTTVTFTNMPSTGYAGFWEVEVIAPGANTVTFSGVTWNGGTVPTLQVGTKKTVYTFRTRDGGTTIYGSSSFNDIV